MASEHYEDDFMEIGNTSLVPIGEGLFLDLRTNEIVDPWSEIDDETEEESS